MIMSRQMNRFLCDLYKKKLTFKRRKTEVRHIQEAVCELIEKIRIEISKNELYEVSHYQLVGSMAEGSSIIEPDEFDVLMILDHLSNTDAITIEHVIEPTEECKTCTDFEYHGTAARYGHKHHHAHVKLDCETSNSILERFTKCLNKEKYLSSDHLGNLFREEVKSAVRNHQDMFLKNTSGELKLGSIDHLYGNGPATRIELLWNPTEKTQDNLTICVDIVPVIQVINPPLINQKKAEFDKNDAVLGTEGHFFLCPPTKKRFCFNLSFTTSEVKRVSELHIKHKMCYCVLKYFFLECGVALSSYIFKTFLLHHSEMCKHRGGISFCVRDILETMSNDINCVHKEGLHFEEKCTFMHSNYVSTYLFKEEKKEDVHRYINDIIRILGIEEYIEYDIVKGIIDEVIADLVTVFTNQNVHDLHAM